MSRMMGTLMIVIAASGLAPAYAIEDETAKGENPLPRVKMETTLGDIILELEVYKAPITVKNFVKYAEDKFYDGMIFHRVVSTFMIQGGGFTPDMKQKKEGLRPGIKNEWKNGLKNVAGSITMARLGRKPDSATSQFFINVVDNSYLDQPRDGAAYAVFGRVVEGMDTVEKIRNTKVDNHEKYGGGRQAVVPVEPVVIKSVRLTGAFDMAKIEEAVKTAKGRAEALAVDIKTEKESKLRDHVEKLEKELGKKAIFTDSGLAYIVLKDGDGDTPEPTDKVTVHYTGWLLNGEKFDSSVDRGEPSTFGLNQVIKGWTIGVGLMKMGAKHKLIIPPEIGYGSRGSGAKIPPNSILVFDVELLEITK